MHNCHAKGCKRQCKPEYLMCYRHWQMVPMVVQRAVWLHYRPGQCDDKQPSQKWHAAADWAIASVALQEGRISKEKYAAVKQQCENVLKG